MTLTKTKKKNQNRNKHAMNFLDQVSLQWDNLNREVMRAILKQRGLHLDEYENYESFLQDMLDLVQEHLQLWYIDSKRQLHHISVKECYFVRPYDSLYGPDHPERALLRNHYECTIQGDLLYTIRIKDEALDPSLQYKSFEEYHGSTGSIPDYNPRAMYSNFTKTVSESLKKDHVLMDLPVLVGSVLCNLRTGLVPPSLFHHQYASVPAYIVNRNFKICPNEEYIANNRAIPHKQNSVEIRSKFYDMAKKFRTNCTLKILIEQTKARAFENWDLPPRFVMEIPHESPRASVPVIVLAMAYGWTANLFYESVCMHMHQRLDAPSHNLLYCLMSDTEGCTTTTQAQLCVGKRLSKCQGLTDIETLSYVRYTLHGEFLANLVTPSHEPRLINVIKGHALAQAVAMLVLMHPSVNHGRNDDEKFACFDKRSYAHKRLETPGEKMASLLRKHVKNGAKKAFLKLRSLVESSFTTDLNAVICKSLFKITGSVRNGVWDTKAVVSEHNQNKTQMLITGFCGDSAHVQSQKIIKLGGSKKNCNAKPMLTHASQTGRVDLYLTPESDKCGIIRFKALGAAISPKVKLDLIMILLRSILTKHGSEFGWVPLTSMDMSKAMTQHITVMDVYGGLMGWVQHAQKLYECVRRYRRTGVLSKYFSIEFSQKLHAIYFNCDEGRLLRPLFVVSKLKEFLDTTPVQVLSQNPHAVQYLLEKGFIEYLDAAEEYSGYILTADTFQTLQACDFEHTHLEIHGCFALSLTVAKAYCTFNQGPRRLYTGNMEKRSISKKDEHDEGTTASYSLFYAQDPLQSDPVDQVMGLRQQEPNGLNVVVAVMSLAENQEDAWILKREAFERGLGMTREQHAYTVVLAEDCVFTKPDSKCRGLASSEKYMYLNEDGSPKTGVLIPGGYAFVGRVFTYKKQNTVFTRCMSKFLPWNVSYRVDSVQYFPCQTDYHVVRVIMSSVNHPSVGDKFFLAHGQKGTCGMVVPSIDLPFITCGVNAGVVPDLFLNVCSLMRITQGLLLELLTSKGRALSPTLVQQYDTMFLNETSFQKKLKLVEHVFRLHGLTKSGRDQMACGKTGRIINTTVFNGVASLRVLKHMAKDKLRSRDRGPTNELTRQTSVGKKNFGGQKVGEMENWNLHAHGIAHMFQNVNYESADKFMQVYCTRCNFPALGSVDAGFFICQTCKQTDALVRVYVPYITNLTFQELYTAGWGHTLVCEPMADAKMPNFVDEAEIYYH